MFTPGKMKPKTDLIGMVLSQSPSQQLRRDVFGDTTLCMTKGTANQSTLTSYAADVTEPVAPRPA